LCNALSKRLFLWLNTFSPVPLRRNGDVLLAGDDAAFDDENLFSLVLEAVGVAFFLLRSPLFGVFEVTAS